MGDDPKVLRSIQHLVRYASLAYDGDGAEFRMNATDLKGPIAARKVESTRYAGNHVHLGVRNRDTLVLAFSGYDFPWNFEDYAQPKLLLGLYRNVWTGISYSYTRLGWPGLTNVLVHKGFLLAFYDLTFDLAEVIGILLEGNNPENIEVCGHSLGGALATLCAFWCSFRWPAARITCVTLGSPRVGNIAFHTEFNNRPNIRCYRLVVDSDLLAGLSDFPDIMFGRILRGQHDALRHVGKEIVLRGSKAHEKRAGNLSPIVDVGRVVDAVERITVYVEEHRMLMLMWWYPYCLLMLMWWYPYCLLRGWQLGWNIRAHSPMSYLTSFQRRLDEFSPEGEEGGGSESRWQKIVEGKFAPKWEERKQFEQALTGQELADDLEHRR